ncbi:MAG TPA: polysaccharide pyruvyl transferase family protein [Bauldia sp.]|nr:polysaccharide pyruvyl transferase family protein [Bauldia sp.]
MKKIKHRRASTKSAAHVKSAAAAKPAAPTAIAAVPPAPAKPKFARPAMVDRPARIGVISPAGRVVNHDEVLTYAHGDPEKSIRQFMNIGDSFVYDSSLKILDFSELVPIYTSEDEKEQAAHIEQINQLDYVFLRGSNYINTSGKWDAITALLEKTNVPIIAFGIGLQAPDNATEFVNESTRRFLQLISDRSASLGVRGELSQKALASIGIRNTRIFGCPTAFRRGQPEIHLRHVEPDSIDRLGFTLRRNTHGRQTLQRYMLRTLAEQYRTTIFCAGELEEKAIYYAGRGDIADRSGVMTSAVHALTDQDWMFGAGDPLLALYRSSLAVFEAVSDFENEMRKMSAVTGFRLHGNLMALANSVPALYVTYDSRTREFVDTLGIPSVESRLMDKFSFRKEWEKADFARFERTYAARFRDLVAFLEENGMRHRLNDGTAETLVAAE